MRPRKKTLIIDDQAVKSKNQPKKGVWFMDSILERDTRKLLDDTRKIKEDLERLEKDYSAWARKREEHDLGNLMEDLKAAEIDVSTMTTDCVSANSQSGSNVPTGVFHDLHQIFVSLDALFNDLKKARSELLDTCIEHDLIEHLEIDCGRFTKTAEQIRRDLDR
jgi:DNA repair exonuclease SbcCD ATPase subunit